MRNEQEPTVISAFPMQCEGAKGAPLREVPANISVTIFNDGIREVGCGYLNRENSMCEAAPDNLCIQLFPSRRVELKTTSIEEATTLAADEESKENIDPTKALQLAKEHLEDIVQLQIDNNAYNTHKNIPRKFGIASLNKEGQDLLSECLSDYGENAVVNLFPENSPLYNILVYRVVGKGKIYVKEQLAIKEDWQLSRIPFMGKVLLPLLKAIRDVAKAEYNLNYKNTE